MPRQGGTFISIFAIFWNARGDKRATTHEIEERVKDNTRINMKLDTITETTRGIKDDLGSMSADLKSHNDRIIKAEESVKSLHKRVDGVENRLNTLKTKGDE